MNPTDVLFVYLRYCWYHAHHRDDDAGAVSVENVLWYVASALGVVVVAAVIWTAIKNKASQPLPTPTGP